MPIAQAVSKHELTESLSEVLDNAVVALLPSVSFSDPALSLRSAFAEALSHGSMAITFWAGFAKRIEKKSKMLSHFEDMASLLKNLPNWRASSPSPKEHMLYAFLQLLTALERCNQMSLSGITGSVVTEILEPLRKKADKLLSQNTLGSTSYAELLQLRKQSVTLDIIESMLFNQHLYNPSWQHDIFGHLARCACKTHVYTHGSTRPQIRLSRLVPWQVASGIRHRAGGAPFSRFPAARCKRSASLGRSVSK